MFLKILKLAAMLVSVMFISPMIKYQPEILKADLEKEVETESTMTQEIINTETAAEAEETQTKEPFAENSVSEKKETAAEKETSKESEDVTKVSTDAAMAAESGVPEHVTEPESGTEVESVTESIEVAVSLESSWSDSETSITAEPSTEHQHTWIPVSKTVHHEAIYQTVHHNAQTERVWIEDKPAWAETYENTYFVAIHAFCRGCGMDLNEAGMTDEEHDAHDLHHILNGEDSGYYEAPIYEIVTETIYHEAEGHYEDRVVQEAYDESVLVSEAWDEEVITGYVCEECGEIQ